MTKRQFLLGVFILVTLVSLMGVGGYYRIESRKIDLQEQKVEAEVEKFEAEKKTERTKERWKFLPDWR